MNKPLPKLKVVPDPIEVEHAAEINRKAHPYHLSRFIVTEDFRFVGGIAERGRMIAAMTDCEGQKELAHLFAAAPDLLEALENALEAIEYYHDHEGSPSLLTAAKSAIAKAKGKQ